MQERMLSNDQSLLQETNVPELDLKVQLLQIIKERLNVGVGCQVQQYQALVLVASKDRDILVRSFLMQSKTREKNARQKEI